MLRYARASWRLLRRHPRLTSTVAFLLLATTAAVGLNLWASYHYRETERALAEERLDDARRHIRICQRIWFRGPATHFLAARIERTDGNFAEAERLLNKCNHLQGGATEATQLEQVLLRAQAGELDEVESGLWHCLQEDHPESSQILETLGRVYMRESRLQIAQVCLTRWIAREPDVPRAWHWRGWIREHLSLADAAIADYLQALELQPDRWGARLRLVKLYLDNKDPVAALPHLLKLLPSHSDSPEVLVSLAQCHILQGDEEKALPLLEKVLAEHPDDLTALTLRGQLDCQQGRPVEGEVWLRRALAANPHDPTLLYSLHTCLRQQPGREAEAETFLARHQTIKNDLERLRSLMQGSVQRSPHDADLAYEVGTLWLRIGRDKQALAWFSRALKDDPNHKVSLRALARYFESQGDEDKATQARNRLAQLNGSSSSADNAEPRP